jgi:CRP/FNR family cyclic AMP-dependent transcriptional regulator
VSEIEECAALIAGSAFFGNLLTGLAEGEVAKIARTFRPARFDAGQSIFARGDKGDFLLIVAEGRIRLSVVSDEGRELSVRHAVKGDIVGEIAALDGRTRSADAAALSAVKCFLLFRADFHALIRAYPVLSTGVIEFLCTRLRSTTEQLEAIALHPIEARLARFLLVALGGRKAEPGRRVPLELGFSQSELAQLLGASRPKVNGALSMLEDMGAVKRTADRLFCDPALLAQTARLADDV